MVPPSQSCLPLPPGPSAPPRGTFLPGAPGSREPRALGTSDFSLTGKKYLLCSCSEPGAAEGAQAAHFGAALHELLHGCGGVIFIWGGGKVLAYNVPEPA